MRITELYSHDPHGFENNKMICGPHFMFRWREDLLMQGWSKTIETTVE